MSESEQTECINCRRPKSTLQCGVCEEPVCKSCGLFLASDTFAFQPKVSEVLRHSHYCPACHQEHVEPALAEYEDKMARAKEMYFFFNTQRSLLPVLKKATNPIRVENCEDRDETVLRLAFLSVDQGYNSVIEAEVVSAKVRNGGHHKHFWKGTAFPANLDLERFERSTLGR